MTTSSNNRKSKMSVEDDFEDQENQPVQGNSKTVEELLKRIADLEAEKGQVTPEGKKVYGNLS